MVKNVNVIQAIDTSDLIKNTDYNTKIKGFEKKITDHDHGNYITTQEFNKLTADNFAARQANLATKFDIDDLVEKTTFDDKQKKLK